jgi:hypothetical protein
MATQTQSGGSSGGNPALRLAAIRQIHVYLGAFIAPSVLFFAITGGLQLFRLHEVRGAFHPPVVIQKLGRLHKNQVFAVKPKRPGQAAATPAPSKPASDATRQPESGPKASTVALRWFFLFVSAALAVSTLLGLWMGLQYNRRKGLIWIMFLAGAVIPAAMLLI